MPSTHLSLHYHLIFSTKERQRWIKDDWRDRLHAYLGGAVRACGGVAENVGGTADHVHLLIGLRATHRLADVLRETKGSSSEWVHREIHLTRFAWQEGYGAFTVSASQIEVVRNYISRQEEHHRRRTFQDEYLEFLKQSGVDFDEKYLW
ncbi:MAG TPA: IS200/IS605 family transposase [Pyrinomonadaceae bacterium]